MLPKRIFGTQTQVSPRLWILESTFRNMCFFSWTFFLSQFLSKCSGLTISFMQGKYRNIHANNFSASARPWSARWPADLNEGNGAEVLTMSGLFYVGFLHLQSLLCKSLHIISSRITTNQGCMYVYMYVYIYIYIEGIIRTHIIFPWFYMTRLASHIFITGTCSPNMVLDRTLRFMHPTIMIPSVGQEILHLGQLKTLSNQ